MGVFLTLEATFQIPMVCRSCNLSALLFNYKVLDGKVYSIIMRD